MSLDIQIAPPTQGQLRVALLTRRHATTSPGVKARPADRQYLADRRHGTALTARDLLHRDEHIRYPSRPKMLNAFFKMSRSRSTRRSSPSNCRTRSSRSDATLLFPQGILSSSGTAGSSRQPQPLADRRPRMTVEQHPHRLDPLRRLQLAADRFQRPARQIRQRVLDRRPDQHAAVLGLRRLEVGAGRVQPLHSIRDRR